MTFVVLSVFHCAWGTEERQQLGAAFLETADDAGTAFPQVRSNAVYAVRAAAVLAA